MEALDCLGDAFRPVAFIDDDDQKVGTTVLGLPVLNRRALFDLSSAKVLAVPGSPKSYLHRASLITSLDLPPDRFATVLHPRAVVSRSAKIGMNVLIMAGSVVTSNAVIDDHVLILPNSVIHHHSRIGAYTVLGAGVLVAGFVSLGDNCYVGSGARFRDHVTVASRTLVGLSSTVLHSIDECGNTWAGTPARRLRPRP
jgi:sugar O-acyltransferase (sialic acid O-acetyltransferase NeuD family)